MGIMSSIYNSDFNIEQLFLGSEEITEMYLGDQLVFSKITNNLFYKLHEFVGSLTVRNTVEAPVKSAILKGNTKYRDIDTGDILDEFDETKNLELISCKMPILTTSNEDGTKTNILTVNEDVELRGIGDVQDELDLLTGELTERIGEIVLDGSENWTRVTTSDRKELTSYFRVNLKDSYAGSKVITDRFMHDDGGALSSIEYECCRKSSVLLLYINIFKSRLASDDVNGFKTWLSENPVTVQYEFATESVKTVDLSSNTVYAYNGTTHYTCSSEEGSLIPTACIEVPVETETVE